MEHTKSNGQKILKSQDGLVRLRDRVTFSSSRIETDYPDLLNVQLASYRDFLQEELDPSERLPKGLDMAFKTNFPIEDSSSIFQLEYINYSVDKPKYSEEE